MSKSVNQIVVVLRLCMVIRWIRTGIILRLCMMGLNIFLYILMDRLFNLHLLLHVVGQQDLVLLI